MLFGLAAPYAVQMNFALRMCLLVVTLWLGALTAHGAAPEAVIPPNFKGIVLRAPLPSGYPIKRLSWSGMEALFRLAINHQTGRVDKVTIVKRSGEPGVDSAFEIEFTKWKFKPGTVRQLDVPVVFRSMQVFPDLSRAVAK